MKWNEPGRQNQVEFMNFCTQDTAGFSGNKLSIIIRCFCCCISLSASRSGREAVGYRGLLQSQVVYGVRRKLNAAVPLQHFSQSAFCGGVPSEIERSRPFPALPTVCILQWGAADAEIQVPFAENPQKSKVPSSTLPRNGELRKQKVKSHLVSTWSLNVLPSKPGVGQQIAIHATLTARDFFLAYFYPSGPFTCICFPKALPVSPVLAVADTWFLCRPAE